MTTTFKEPWTNDTLVPGMFACPHGEQFKPGEYLTILEERPHNRVLAMTLGGVALVPRNVLEKA